MFKPKFSQIDGGVQLQSDVAQLKTSVEALETSYDAAKVTTSVAKADNSKYNADELLAEVKAGVDAVDGKIQEKVDAVQADVDGIKAQKVADYVRVPLTAEYNADTQSFTVDVSDVQIPGMDADASKALSVYTPENKVVLGADGNAVTFDLTAGTFSSTPSELDKENTSKDGVVYKPLTANFDFKVFPVGYFTFGELSEDYLLDNSELQTAIYGQAIEQIVGELAEDDKIHEDIKSQVTEAAITKIVEKTTDPIKADLTALQTEVAEHKQLAETYVTADGLKGAGKKIIEVAAGDLVENGTDAVNAGQLFAVDAAYKAADTDLKTELSASIDAAKEAAAADLAAYKAENDPKVAANSTAITEANGKITTIEGYVTADGLNANDKVITHVADGAIDSDSTDAINGRQLSEQIANVNSTIETNHENLAGQLKTVEGTADQAKTAAETAQKAAEDAKAEMESYPGTYMAKANVGSGTTITSADVFGGTADMPIVFKQGDVIVDVNGEYYAVESVDDSGAASVTPKQPLGNLTLPTKYIVGLDDKITALTEADASNKTELQGNIDAVQANVDKVAAATVSVVSAEEKTFVVDLSQQTDALATITLPEAPNASKITINVNGFVYEEEAGAFTRGENNTLAWAFGSANGGFDLTKDVADKLVVRYFVDKTTEYHLAVPTK